MKAFFLVLTLLLSSTVFAKVNSKEVERKVGVLAGIAYGYEVHKISAKDAKEMVLKMYMERNSLSRKEALESFYENLPAKDIVFGDMIGWGTMQLDAATALFESQDLRRDDNGDDIDNSKGLALGGQILKELSRMGIKFGFTDGSSSYCGVSFMGLLIVDEENGQIYEVSLTDGGPC